MGHSVEMLERCYAHEIREYRGRGIDIASEVASTRADIMQEAAPSVNS